MLKPHYLDGLIAFVGLQQGDLVLGFRVTISHFRLLLGQDLNLSIKFLLEFLHLSLTFLLYFIEFIESIALKLRPELIEFQLELFSLLVPLIL